MKLLVYFFSFRNSGLLEKTHLTWIQLSHTLLWLKIWIYR